MSVTRAATNVIVVEDSDEEIQARLSLSCHALELLDLDHFEHHMRRVEATSSNLCRGLGDLPRARAMRDRIAASLEAMEARVQSLEAAEGEPEER